MVRSGYKQSQVGLIPDDWNVMPAEATFLRPAVRQCQVDTSGYLTRGLYPIVDQGKKLVTAYSNDGARVLRAPEGGVVVFGDHTCIVKFVDFDFTVGADGVQVLVPRPGHDARFLSYSFAHPGVQSTGYNRHFNLLREMPLAVPGIAEQRAIAQVLSDTDRLIESLGELIAKKESIKAGAIHELLSGSRRLAAFTEDWKDRSLSEIGVCLRGVSYSPETDLRSAGEGETFALLRATNVQRGAIDTDDVYHVVAARVAEHQILTRDDILICAANGSKALVGKSALFNLQERNYTFGAFMSVFRTAAADARFVYYTMQTAEYRRQLAVVLAGSSINNLTPSDIEGMRFRFPPLDEQRAIAQVLSDMDAELAELRARQEKTILVKEALMDELLTGRTRLT